MKQPFLLLGLLCFAPALYIVILSSLILARKLSKSLFSICAMSCLASLIFFVSTKQMWIFGIFFGIPYIYIFVDSISGLLNKDLKILNAVLFVIYFISILTILGFDNVLKINILGIPQYSGFLIERILFLITAVFGLLAFVYEKREEIKHALICKTVCSVMICLCWMYIFLITFKT